MDVLPTVKPMLSHKRGIKTSYKVELVRKLNERVRFALVFKYAAESLLA